jgi:phosphinothricin acetyltransferase
LDATVNTESGAGVVVRAMTAEDWPDAARIYTEGIATREATFETTAPAWADWDAAHTREHRWVATIDGAVAGWVACSPVSTRCVYAGVLELSVYVAATARGRGVGSALLGALVDSTEAAGVWTLETGIFPENTASLALHVKHGFRVVGTRERIGQMDGVWRDTVLLERRSALVR